jgi:ABC-2 type transport system ATP-binding protein
VVAGDSVAGEAQQGTREVRTLIREVAEEGVTVFVSSHLLTEVEQVCTHAAVLSRGRLVADGEVEQLRRSVASRIVVRTPDAAPAMATLTRLGFAGVMHDVAADGAVRAVAGAVPVEQACAALVADAVRVQGLSVDRPSLEDAFVALTGEGFDVAG